MTGAQEVTSLSLLEENPAAEVFHLLPTVCRPLTYGTTIPAGRDMEERREILGRSAPVYVLIEGGPGSVHEVEIALRSGGWVIPLKITGGAAGGMFGVAQAIFTKPEPVQQEDWTKVLEGENESPEAIADAILRIYSSLTESEDLS
jgi:hypothetical protein